MKIAGDCSGLGAFEVALNRLGKPYRLEFASELNEYARKGYLGLHTPKKMYNDIRERDNSKYLEPLDLYFCGFPCQPFSLSGNRLNFNDVRGTVFFECVKFIQANKPKVVVLENVRGLMSVDNGRAFYTILDILSNGGGTVNGQLTLDQREGLGYHVYHNVLNSIDYNAPQHRERVFIVCFKDFKAFTFPKPIPRVKTIYDCLDELVDDKYILSKKMVDFITRHRIKRGKPAKMYIDQDFSHTLSARYHKQGAEDTYVRDPNGNPRRLTPIECFRLMGFNDQEYNKVKASGLSDTRLYNMAGNSISVEVLVELFKKIYP